MKLIFRRAGKCLLCNPFDKALAWGRQMNILVVAEPNLANFVAKLLSIHGYRVLALIDPADALEHAQAISFDLAFLGIVMPGMNGLDLGTRIRKLLPRCAVILLGAESVPGVLEHARSLRYDFDYLPLPFEVEELLSKIRRMCPNF